MEYIPTPEEQQEYLDYDSYEVFFANLEKGIEDIQELKFSRKKGQVLLIAGAMVVFDKGIVDFMNHMAETDTDCQYVLLSEVTAEFRRKTRDVIRFEAVCTPHLLAKEILVPYMNVPVSQEVEVYLETREYLRRAVEIMEKRYDQIGSGYAKNLMYYAEFYISEVLKKICPDCVLLWNEFHPFHIVMEALCEKFKIPVKYMEFGCVPGTFAIEKSGQQGESWPARHPFFFRHLPVSCREKARAGEVVEYIYRTGLNRNPQPSKRQISSLFAELIQDCAGGPIITYMGQNDYESGLYPYTERTRKYHSPVFKTTLEALEMLRLLSVKNGWRLLYKPHPLLESMEENQEARTQVCRKEDKVYFLEKENVHEVIDMSDVVVTILSQSAYISLFRGKPAVMLGYTQLKGSGCTYEAFSRESVEHAIKEALQKKFSRRQKKHFIRHLAQELKYYLWDDGTHPEFPFGKI